MDGLAAHALGKILVKTGSHSKAVIQDDGLLEQGAIFLLERLVRLVLRVVEVPVRDALELDDEAVLKPGLSLPPRFVN